MKEKIENQISRYKERINKISRGGVVVSRFDNSATIDFRLDIEGVREVNSSLAMDSNGVIMIELRLPVIWENTSQIRAQQRLDNLLHSCGFPKRTYTYVRPRSMNPHVRLENPPMSDDELFNSIRELMDRIDGIRGEN